MSEVPYGWARVISFPHGDHEFIGPVLTEDNEAIAIEVAGLPEFFDKAHYIVEHAPDAA